MTITFERRTDQPDAAGRCLVYVRAAFDGQRLRMSTGERCTASEWNEDKGKFRKSFAGFQEANDRLDALGADITKANRELRTAGKVVTPALLKEALKPKVAEADLPPAPLMADLFGEYIEVLRARGFRFHTLKGYKTAHNTLLEFGETLPERLTTANYDAGMHDALQGHLRDVRGSAQNTVAGVVKQLKPFLAWARDDRGQKLAVEPAKLKVEWEDVEKVWLTAAELGQLEKALLPASLVAVRDAFLFCCYTGLRYSDLAALHEGNVKEWDGGRVLRLTQTKTRTGVSIYLTPPAAALLDKYAGTREKLLPSTANQVMNRYLKRISRLAGVEALVEVVETIGGRVMKRPLPKWELVTMHTARHTFATQSLLRGMPVEVLQKVLGHSKIQTTMIYAKVVEDLQHQTMRRIWEGAGTGPTDKSAVRSEEVCAVVPEAEQGGGLKVSRSNAAA
ncbi:site-specific integrase [Hymenobacter ruricola]|uniref:Tyrosine-type recombinase/integrase n=1 Tax=Hymenobacter ruricola TaxID=2791023 RepID=A0ABS0I6B1_9BACT|nr:site-specific integrase [Hymenobacter ruricola]MBF9222506.1 tyrosine-type recombinase/integrase [Hymenobacter ruricola]